MQTIETKKNTTGKMTLFFLTLVLATALCIGLLLTYNHSTLSAPDTTLVSKVPGLTITDVVIDDDNRSAHTTDSGVGIGIKGTPLNSIVDVKFTIENTGLTDLTVTTSYIKLAWDAAGNLPVKNYAYLYPGNLQDETITANITMNHTTNHGNTALSYSIPDAEIQLNNGTSRQGMAYNFVATPFNLTPGATQDFSFKVAYYRSKVANFSQTFSEFAQFNKKDLAVDVDLRGLGPNAVFVGDETDMDINVDTIPVMANPTGGTNFTTAHRALAVWGMPDWTGGWVNPSGITQSTNMVMQRNWVQEVEFVSDDIDYTAYQVGDTYRGLPVLSSRDVSLFTDETVRAFITPSPECYDGANQKPKQLPAVNNSPSRSAIFLKLYIQSSGGADGVIAETNLRELFAALPSLHTADLSLLRVDETTNFYGMFNYSYSLDTLKGIEDWKMGNATNLYCMFYSSVLKETSPNSSIIDLSKWDTHNVTDISYMFSGNCNDDDVFNATDWHIGAYATQPMGKGAFIRASSIDISNWNLSKLSTASRMFRSQQLLPNIKATNIVFPSSNTALNITTDRMFQFTRLLTTLSGLNTWDTSRFYNTSNMFRYVGANRTANGLPLLELDFAGWDLSNNISLATMFEHATSIRLINFNDIDARNVTSALQMFRQFDYGTGNVNYLQKLEMTGWNLSSCKDYRGMFYNVKFKEVDLSGWVLKTTGTADVLMGDNAYQDYYGGATNDSTYGMFAETQALITISGLDTWDVSKVKSFRGLFYNKGYSINVAPAVALNLDGWDVSGCDNFQAMFHSSFFPTISAVDWKLVDPSLNTQQNIARMFTAYDDRRNTHKRAILGLETWDTKNIVDTRVAFSDNRNLSTETLQSISVWDMSSVQNARGMFAVTSYNMPAFDWDLKNMNWSSCTDFQGMFNYTPISDLDVSGWTLTTAATANIKLGGSDTARTWQTAAPSTSDPQAGMFSNVRYLRKVIGLNTWNVSRVANMEAMFTEAGYQRDNNTIEIDISGWDLSNCESMRRVFARLGGGKNTVTVNINATGVQLPTDSGKSLDMSGLFTQSPNVSTIQGISSWNTVRVTNMRDMFSRMSINTAITSYWAINLSSWNVSNVTNMQGMFRESRILSSYGNLRNWDVSKVQTMAMMFAYRSPGITSINLSGWDVSSLTQAAGMFYTDNATNSYASLEAIDISNWTFGASLSIGATTNVSGFMDYNNLNTSINPGGMFQYARYLTTIAGIKELGETGTLTNLSNMFNGCTSLNLEDELNDWDVSQVTQAVSTFENTGNSLTQFKLNLTNWNLPLCTSTNRMFYGITKMTSGAFLANDLTLGDGLTGTNYTNASEMFSGNYYVPLDVTNWDVSRVNNMNSMFANTRLTSLQVGNWDTSNVANMSAMFSSASWLISLSGLELWDVGNVATTKTMFASLGNTAATPFALNLDNWSLDKNLDYTSMFSNAAYLVTLSAANWSFYNQTTSALAPANYMLLDSMFESTTRLSTIAGITDWDVSAMNLRIKSFMRLFKNSSTNPIYHLESLDLSDWKCGNSRPDEWGTKGTRAGEAFMGFGYNTELILTNFISVSSGYEMWFNDMFNNAHLSTLTGLETWDMSYVNNTKTMFNAFCNTNSTLTELDLSSWTFPTVDMTSMFATASLSSIDTSDWNFASAASVNATTMFNGATRLSTLPGINTWTGTDKITNVSSMFANVGSHTSASFAKLNLSSWTLSSCTNFSSMFSGFGSPSTGTELDLSNVVKPVGASIDMSNMFANGRYLTKINVSGWDLSGAATALNISSMFLNVFRIDYLPGINTWQGTDKITNATSAFQSLATGGSLAALNLSNWSLPKCSNFTSMFAYFGAPEAGTALNITNLVKATSLATNMTTMFYNIRANEVIGLNTFDTSTVTNMESIFCTAWWNSPTPASLTLDLSNWNTVSVSSLSQAFYAMRKIQTLVISNWETPSVTNTYRMFRETTELVAIDMKRAVLNTGLVTNRNEMFNAINSGLYLTVKDNDQKTWFSTAGMPEGRIIVG